ncbi:MAG: MFS transporter [Planctomycetota bacterium]|nr:MFS transporter [Planctomycetota bacterium]
MISPDFPFSPARLPFFYGWFIVFVSTVGTILSIPGQTMGVSVFTDFLIRDLGISRNELSSAYMGGTIASACCLPVAGYLFDRLGARSMIVVSSLALAGTLLFLSSCERIASVASRELSTVFSSSTVSFAVLCVGFFSLRFWGQGVLTMVSRAMLGKWFDRRRGFAAALSGVFVSAAFALAPVVLLARISSRGWRGAWVELATVCAAWALVGGIFYRDNPEECGLEMDGGPRPRDAAVSPALIVHEFTLVEALKTYSFWVASLSLSLFGLVITGLTFHITSIGAKHGLLDSESVAIFVPMAAVSVASNFVIGWLSDRIRIRNLFWVLLGAQAIGSGALLSFGTPSGRVLVAIGFGVAGGVFALLTTVIWPRFYGRAHLGAISGISMALTVFGSALGPKIFALAESRDGRYDASFLFGVISALVLMVASVGIDNPQRSAAAPTPTAEPGRRDER